jgi:type III secretion system (T3SS) SseB-like protein
MSFVPQNELEELLIRAASEPSARPEFYRFLFESDLYVIGEIRSTTPQRSGIAANAGDQLMIASVEYNNRRYHPVFSSLSRVRTFDQSVDKYFALNGRALFENTQGAYFLLNPGSDYGKELLPAEIANLLSPNTRRSITIEKPTQVMIGPPAVYPQALVDALKVMFEQRPEVIAAHLIQIQFDGTDEESHPLIGIETIGDWQSLSGELGRILKAVNPMQVVDVIPINRSDSSGVMQALMEVSPFYSRTDKN